MSHLGHRRFTDFWVRAEGQLIYVIYFVVYDKFLRYISISVILRPNAGFLSLLRVIHFTQLEKGILCPKS